MPYLMSSSIFAWASKSKGSAVRSLILSCSLLARSCCCSSNTLVKRSVEKQTVTLTWPIHIRLTAKHSKDKLWHVKSAALVFVYPSLRWVRPQQVVGFAPWGVKAHVDWIIASAGVRQGHRAPEERGRERPLVWKAVWCVAAAAVVVTPVVAALWHHVDWLKERCRGLWWNESQCGADLRST